MTILVLIEIAFAIMLEILHGRISLNSVVLLLPVNCVSGFRLELMYISLIKSIRSNLIYLHGFQLHVLLPQFTEMTFFICTKNINLLNLKLRQASNCCKRFLEAARLAYTSKKKSPSLSRNLAVGTFSELPIVLLTKVSLVYLLYSTGWRCCLFHLTK